MGLAHAARIQQAGNSQLASATCAVSHSGTAPIITINSGFELNWPNSVLERAGNQPLALILKECTS